MKNILKQNQGFSFVEILVAAGMLSFLSLAAFNVVQIVKKGSKKIEIKAVQKGEEEFLNKFLYKHLASAHIDISYGILNIPDDSGDSDKTFLDLLPDYHSHGIVSDSDKSRTFALTNDKQILFLSAQDNFKRFNLMELFDYDYERLYSGDTPTNAFFNNCYLKKELDHIWQDKGLVLIYTPAFLREAIPVNMNEFPKKPAFIGYMSGAKAGSCSSVTADAQTFSLKKYEKLNPAPTYFNFPNPAPPTGGTYTSIKDFILKSHLLGGQDVVLAGAIQLIVLAMKNNKLYYCLIKDKDSSITCDETNGLMFAEGIKHITFKREDVAKSQMNISFEFL